MPSRYSGSGYRVQKKDDSKLILSRPFLFLVEKLLDSSFFDTSFFTGKCT